MSNTMGNKYESSNAETLSGAKTLAVTDSKYQFLDPGGSGRNVDLPDMRTLTTDINSEGTGDAGTDRYADTQGGFFVISNTADAAEVITVRGWNGSSTTGTIMTPTQDETAVCYWTGATNGWIGIAGSDA